MISDQNVPFTDGARGAYALNQQLIDAVSFRNVEDAFAWIRENRAKVISKEGTPEKPIELSLGYIAAILDVAGKLEGIDVQTLQRKCAAYDNYLANKQLVDAVSFRNVEDAFAWIRSNRANVISKEKAEEPFELSLSYIVNILEVAGKLERIDVQKLTWKCAAYDFYLAKKHYFDSITKRVVSGNRDADFEDVRKEFERMRGFTNATAVHSLKMAKPISKNYLRLILSAARDDIEKEITRFKRLHPSELTNEDIRAIRESYGGAVAKLVRKKTNADLREAIKKKRREVTLMLTYGANSRALRKLIG